jgi:hypothetical protein
VFVVSTLKTFKALGHKVTTEYSMFDCSVRCVQHNLCLTFTFKATDGECRLYSTIMSTDPKAPDVSVDEASKLYIADVALP